MLRRVGFGILWAIPGYLLGAVAGAFLINALSGNSFDGDMEAVMTGAFATGPLVGLVAFGVGAMRAGRPAPDR